MNGGRRSTKGLQVEKMDKSEALRILEESPELWPSERLIAAREIARSATTEDKRRLVALRGRENDPWVRRVLDKAIAPIAASLDPAEELEGGEADSLDGDLDISEIVSLAKAETAAFFLHEIRPLLGAVDLFGSLEVCSYDGSRTKEAVERVRAFLAAIEGLNQASEPPANRELDLTDLVVRAAGFEVQQGRAAFFPPVSKAPMPSERPIAGIEEQGLHWSRLLWPAGIHLWYWGILL